MTAHKPLARIEKLLAELMSRTEREIPKDEVAHVLRVTRAQIEMVEQGLEED